MFRPSLLSPKVSSESSESSATTLSQAAQSEILKQQQIDESGPGSILADFQMLLEFVGTAGIKTGGKNHRLPLALLSELDARMTSPLQPNQERPSQVSYPHLNGLYLLFRSTGLGIASGEGDKGRLTVNPRRLAEWLTLNPVEQYFTLFGATLSAEWSMIDANERGDGWGVLSQNLRYWHNQLPQPQRAGVSAAKILLGWKNQTIAALLELFGMVELPRVPAQKGENWRITSLKFTTFGQALFARWFDSEFMFSLIDVVSGRADDGKPKWLGELYRDAFPDCVRTLGSETALEGEPVEGVWQFKVSLGKVWRRIIVPAKSSVDDLIVAILAELDFDNDHLYALECRDRSGKKIQIGHPYMEDVDYDTDEFAVGLLPLDPGQSLKLTYDFGDNWLFTLKLEKLLPADPGLTAPRVIDRKGDAPKQYSDNDDDFDDDVDD